MSKLKLAIFENLSNGGARELFKSNYTFLNSQQGIKIYRYSEPKRTFKNLFHYLVVVILRLKTYHRKLAKKINNQCDKVLVYHSWITKSPIFLRFVKTPVLYICHEPPREFYDKQHQEVQEFKEKIINLIRLPIKLIDKKNVKNKNIFIIANSKRSQKLINKVYQKDAALLYPGIKTKEFFPDNQDTQKKHQVISVGSINKLKRFHFLIKVIAKIKPSQRPDLLIVGNGICKSYFKKLQALAENRNVNFKIKVNISKQNLVKHYLESRVFLYAPINEPFGIVVLEAMAAGLPLIVYKKGGGYSEILTEKNGYLVPNLNIKDWSENLEKILSNNKISKKIGKFNSQYVKRFDQKIMNKKLLKLIKKI